LLTTSLRCHVEVDKVRLADTEIRRLRWTATSSIDFGHCSVMWKLIKFDLASRYV
jgi:hypothetical protein